MPALTPLLKRTALVLAALAVTAAGTVALSQSEVVQRALNDEFQIPEQSVRTAKALQALDDSATPEERYATYNAFARAHFGAEHEPLVYEFFGSELVLVDSGHWTHASLTSSAVAFETSLPALSWVEYGLSPDYGYRTAKPERHFYLHLHHLRDLAPGTQYHYRVVVEDERGNRLASEDRTFTTTRAEGVILLPGNRAGPPYLLDQPDTVYVLTEDITTPSTAFQIRADRVTLDLNGHQVVYAAAPEAPEGNHGVYSSGGADRRLGPTGVTVLNGTLTQADSPLLQENRRHQHFSPLRLRGYGTEIAGLDIAYHGPQVWGIDHRDTSGPVRIHHNVITDRGGVIRDRRGAANRAVGLTYSSHAGLHETRITHNLVKRTRQNGLSGGFQISHNEVHVDSHSTNSFAIQPRSRQGLDGGSHFGNRIFGTGFNAYGFGWAGQNLNIHDNLIHFQGIDLSHRWPERWGDVNLIQGMRVTNYSSGRVRIQLRYWSNLISLRGRDGVEMRGTGFFDDASIEGLQFFDNTVKVISEDSQTTNAAALSAHGRYSQLDSNPVIYDGNKLISNIAHIRLGDSYGRGQNHWFISNELIRVGRHPGYHTMVMGGAFWVTGHRLIDNRFVDGAAWDDLYVQRTSGNRSHYSVEWTLSLETTPGALVTIKDAAGELEFTGTADDSGHLTTTLTQAVVQPVRDGDVIDAAGSRVSRKTPHAVTVESGGELHSREITMDRPQVISIHADRSPSG
ncbi:MAG: hypothetical protein JJT85_13295 [Chromatiales bacterium]|nr:hypothetical protein [Chromatiales bacterium]